MINKVKSYFKDIKFKLTYLIYKIDSMNLVIKVLYTMLLIAFSLTLFQVIYFAFKGDNFSAIISFVLNAILGIILIIEFL